MVYRESFYRFLVTRRNPDSHDEIAEFANNAQYDQRLPKQEQDYEKLSDYSGLNASHLPSMTTFDRAHELYKDNM